MGALKKMDDLNTRLDAEFVAAEDYGHLQPDYEPEFEQSPAPRLKVVDIVEFVTMDLPPREEMLSPWLLTQSLSMIYAWRGVGKTHVALGIAYAVATGGAFLGWKATGPQPVLYLDGEMPAADLQERLSVIVANADVEPEPGMLRLVTPDLQKNFIPDLASREGQIDIDKILGDAKLIIVDNLSCWARSGGRENDAESWGQVSNWLLMKRAAGLSVIFIHHSGKGGLQRGTSKREDILDTVICLKHPADYDPADGAVFEVHFEKARGLHGEAARPIEARLMTDEANRQTWAMQALEEGTYDRVVTLANDGLTQTEIATELGVNKSSVCRHFKKAKLAGLII